MFVVSLLSRKLTVIHTRLVFPRGTFCRLRGTAWTRGRWQDGVIPPEGITCDGLSTAGLRFGSSMGNFVCSSAMIKPSALSNLILRAGNHCRKVLFDLFLCDILISSVERHE